MWRVSWNRLPSPFGWLQNDCSPSRSAQVLTHPSLATLRAPWSKMHSHPWSFVPVRALAQRQLLDVRDVNCVRQSSCCSIFIEIWKFKRGLAPDQWDSACGETTLYLFMPSRPIFFEQPPAARKIPQGAIEERRQEPHFLTSGTSRCET